jgi:phospholipase C
MPARPVLAFAAAVAIAGCHAASGAGGAAQPPGGSTSSVGTASAPSVGTPCGWKHTTRYRHVIWIWMENRSYNSVLGAHGEAKRLARYGGRCGVATNYHAISHPSLPNYIAAVAGTTFGLHSDCAPTQCPQNHPSVFGQLTLAGSSWRTYADGMQVPCDRRSYDRYAARHNPAVYFPPIDRQCQRFDVALAGSRGPFARALSGATLPAFALVAPDLCHDGHDCSTASADGWLGPWLDRIVTSRAYAGGDTAVFVTWDEGVGADQHIATVVLGPTVPAGIRASAAFSHYSLLRTTEELLGVPLLGNATGARSMRAAFSLT